MFDFTIIVATLFDDAPLAETLRSCVAQSGVSLEVLVFIKNRRFPLESPLIRVENRSNTKVVFLEGDDSGIADAWNCAVSRSQGKYLCFLGAGDYLRSPTTLRECLVLMSEAESEDLVFFGEQNILTEAGEKRWPAPHVITKATLRRGMLIPHASSFWPRSAFENGLFDPDFSIALDYEFALRASASLSFRRLPIEVCVVLPGGLSNSPKRMLQVIQEDSRARKKNGLAPGYVSVINFKRATRWVLARIGLSF